MLVALGLDRITVPSMIFPSLAEEIRFVIPLLGVPELLAVRDLSAPNLRAISIGAVHAWYGLADRLAVGKKLTRSFFKGYYDGCREVGPSGWARPLSPRRWLGSISIKRVACMLSQAGESWSNPQGRLGRRGGHLGVLLGPNPVFGRVRFWRAYLQPNHCLTCSTAPFAPKSRASRYICLCPEHATPASAGAPEETRLGKWLSATEN